MIKTNNMWKNLINNRRIKRNINELEFANINLNDYILLDVRSRREYREKHLDGAINIPLSEVKINLEKHIRNKNKKILVYCQSGNRSRKAVQIAEELGYVEVYNLKGGLENI